MNAWVLSASKYGSTTEVAAAIGDRIGAAGHQVRVLDAGEVDDFNGADAVAALLVGAQGCSRNGGY